MRLFKRITQVIAIIISGFFITAVIGGTLFLNLYPAFGGTHSEIKKVVFQKSGHYKDGIFINQIPTKLDMNFGKIKSILQDYINGIPRQKPENPLPVLPLDSMTIASKSDSAARITWFGHSAFLLEIKGMNILLDPMFGTAAAPHPWLGPNRFSEGLPIKIEKLPQIDMVLFSHDHYDHLDYGTIIKLENKVKAFYTPLGVGSHLAAWGVPESKISELNWWDETVHDEILLALTPARHFSGRGIFDRSTTLWGSWVIKFKDYSIYFSGDTGYGPHFRQIAEKYGTIDFAMLECGQYDKRWESVHMLPEQTVQAALDLQSRMMMPIHWGSFVLALHSWDDPVIRVTKRARELHVPIIIPKIGEMISLNNPISADNTWWEKWN